MWKINMSETNQADDVLADDVLADTIAEQIIENQVDNEVAAIGEKVGSKPIIEPQPEEAPNPLRKFINDLLKHMVERKGSDLFITVGAPASIKIFGEMIPVSNQPLTPEIVRAIIDGIMNAHQQAEFANTKECNFAISLPDVGRFRVNAYVQRGQPGMVARTITAEVPVLGTLGLPPVLARIIMEKRGLVLMVGGTGSGKSTTLAAMIGYRNANSKGHIITLEDPIEYVHPHNNCIVMQREIGADTNDWFAALKNTLRQAPDVILIGEVREEETMEYAIAFAETGHLCLSTLHANSANQALDRIINFFPEERRKQLLTDLSLNIKAIISQRLIPKKGGGRAVAIEILLNSPLVQDMILNGRMGDIKGAMAKSRGMGMQTFDQSLNDLVINGIVEPEIAVTYADSVNNLKLMLRQAGIILAREDEGDKHT